MFKVPEQYRIKVGRLASDESYGNNGAFVIPAICNHYTRIVFLVIASDGTGWEHISAHVEKGRRCFTPSWVDMCYMKDLFWDAEDVVMQLHPKLSQYINNHPNTLHLWRPKDEQIPTPPSILVGVKL